MLLYMLLVVVSLTWTRDVTVHAVRVRRGAKHLTDSQKAEMLRRHNELRAHEGASDMELLRWHDGLAEAAKTWADNCSFAHGLPPVPGSKAGYAQNMYARGGDMERWFAKNINNTGKPVTVRI